LIRARPHQAVPTCSSRLSCRRAFAVSDCQPDLVRLSVSTRHMACAAQRPGQGGKVRQVFSPISSAAHCVSLRCDAPARNDSVVCVAAASAATVSHERAVHGMIKRTAIPGRHQPLCHPHWLRHVARCARDRPRRQPPRGAATLGRAHTHQHDQRLSARRGLEPSKSRGNPVSPQRAAGHRRGFTSCWLRRLGGHPRCWRTQATRPAR